MVTTHAQKPTILTSIVPPEGARIHIVSVNVVHNCPWQEAIDSAGPDTPADYRVHKVGDHYPPVRNDEVQEDLLLLNFPRGVKFAYETACGWAKRVGLNATVPREVFAVGKQYPELHRALGQDPTIVVSTTKCIVDDHRRGISVWWHGSERGADLIWPDEIGRPEAWFAFR